MSLIWWDSLRRRWVIMQGGLCGKKQIDFNCQAQQSNNNIILYRYADFLLLMADVYNELDETDRAANLVNEVLRRARTSVSPEASQPVDFPRGLSKDQMRKKIFYERLFELAAEPEMYFDIRRGERDFENGIGNREPS